MTSGERLKALREKKGLTQAEVAKYLGVAQPTITKYERDVKKPSTDMLMVLSDYFGVTVDYILKGKD